MSETRKTLTLVGVAAVLLLLALVTAPGKVNPEAFDDVGEPFFGDFVDPNAATTLEVIEFNEETGTAKPFKVTFEEGVWTIPSHHNYLADGKDRLAKTAAGLIGIRKDGLRSNNTADHEACGVVDPLDETTTSLTGRGERVTVKDASGQALADLIIGKATGEEGNLHFVRVPGQKRVYVSRLDLDISTSFADWIETDLLEVEKDDVDKVIIKDYFINERTRRVVERGEIPLSKDDGTWTAAKMRSSEEVNSTKMDNLLAGIDELSIVGVRPKPEGLSLSLQRSGDDIPISQEALLSLQSKGFYFTRDGSLLSNEGELEVETAGGVTYILRFGEVLYGSDEAVTAGTDSSDDESAGPGENRYLFITTTFNADRFPEPRKPPDLAFQGKTDEDLTDQDKKNKELHEKYQEWEKEQAENRETSQRLNQRFAEWYYVISSSSFDKIHLEKGDLIQEKSE